MLIKQDGNLQKRHHTHIYMRCIYYIICIHVHTYWMILDVSKRGVLDRRVTILNFSLHILSILVVIFLCWSGACFFGEYLHILHIDYTILHYCPWKGLVAIYTQILHICSTWKARDGRKCVKNFGVLGVSGLNK